MTTARESLVDPSVTRYYHCISSCVRQAMLCGEGAQHRKAWIEERLEVLANAFALSVCGFAVMDNHLHVLIRLDPEEAQAWSVEEVARRWITVYPPKTKKGEQVDVTQAWLDNYTQDSDKVAKLRERLANLGWFMKALKEPLARMANKEDECRGAFWASRYKSIAILDETALLTTCAYIDLNPVAANCAETPEDSLHTSIRQRLLHAAAKGKLESLRAAAHGTVGGSLAAGNIEEDLWLCPLEDRRQHGAQRAGMLEGFSLGSYLLLVDYTSRLCRDGKAHVSDTVETIFDRLGSNVTFWSRNIQTLLSKKRLFGSYFTTDATRLRELARRRGVHHLDNLTGTVGS